MIVRMSLAVMTRWTPLSAAAALVSMDNSRPCGTVLRKILQYSIPGRRRLCVYSARPLTLARASSRGIARPTWLMVSMSSMNLNRECLPNRTSDIDTQQLSLVSGGALGIAYDRGLVSRHFAGLH